MSKARSSRPSPVALALRKVLVSGFVVLSFAAYVVHDHLVQNADPAPTGDGGVAASTGNDTLIHSSVTTSQQIVPTVQQVVPTSQHIAPTLQVLSAPQSSAPEQQVAPTSVPVLPTATPVPPTATPQSQGQYKDGTYQGPTVNVFYGLVQVQATISGGQITDVQFLQYPHDRRTSQQINSIAMPYLVREALQAQSAYINIITGATLTSEGFAQSLYTVLNQVKN